MPELSLASAFQILDDAHDEAPLEAIRWLRAQAPSEAIRARLTEVFLACAEPGAYTVGEGDDEAWVLTPLWYSFVAETQIHPDLIDPVIQGCLGPALVGCLEWNEQCAFLLGSLAKAYPAECERLLFPALLDAVQEGNTAYGALFDALYFIDPGPHEADLVAVAEKCDADLVELFLEPLSRWKYRAVIPPLTALFEQEKWGEFSKEAKWYFDLCEGRKTNRDPAEAACEFRADWEKTIRAWEQQWQDLAEEALSQEEELPDIKVGPGVVTTGDGKPWKGDDVGRNDPCPCGSGKKYKHCCLNKPAS